MEEKWLKYLSEQNNKDLIPFMEKYFSDQIDFEELNSEVFNLNLLSFHEFIKEENYKLIEED